MNKKILLASAAVLMTFGAANAYADCNGIYLGVRGGVYKPKIKETKGGSHSFEYGKSALYFSGAVGYRYDYVRFELEAILRESKDEKATIPPAQKVKNEFSANSYMANAFWDLSPYTMFTPYLMGGVGISKVELSTKSTFPTIKYKENSNFTWALGAGISAKVTSRFNVDLGYRYFDLGKVNHARVTTSEGYLGLRYVF